MGKTFAGVIGLWEGCERHLCHIAQYEVHPTLFFFHYSINPRRRNSSTARR